jgi:branched-chain amino acid transport system permease protein
LFAVWFAAHTTVSPLLALPIAFVVLSAVGAVLQPLLIEPLMGQGRKTELLSLLVTFGLDYLFVEVALQVWGSNYVSLPYLQSTWTAGSITVSKALVVAGLFAAAIALGMSLLLNRTNFGKSLLAASQNQVGAACCGIDVRRTRMLAFGLGFGLAGSAGVLLILVTPMAAVTADNFTVLAFVLIALGGLGSDRGVVVASLLVGIGQAVVGFYVGGDAASVLPYVLLIAVMALRPQGLQRV